MEIAVDGLIVAVSWAVHAIVHLIWYLYQHVVLIDSAFPLTFDALVQWVIVVSVAREYGKVVVSLILDQGIVPAVADQDVLEINVVCSAHVYCVLLHEILGDDWSIMSTWQGSVYLPQTVKGVIQSQMRE